MKTGDTGKKTGAPGAAKSGAGKGFAGKGTAAGKAGGAPRKPEGFAKRPEGFAKKQSGTAKKPEGFAKKPEGAAKRAEGFAKRPEGFARRTNEIAKPVGPTRPAGPSRPANTARPAGPSRPANTARPANPPRPGGPSRPMNPARPGGPSRPANTARPAGPSRPANTSRPAGPSRPASTARPAGPSRPANTARPTNPARPAGPSRPANTTRSTTFSRPPVRRTPLVPAESTGLSIGARRAALDVLQEVHQKGAYAALALGEKLARSPLKPVDKRLVTSIVYGTLENQIQIDYALDKFMERPTGEPLQRDILRLSACQILFHDRVPDSAAVNEGVNLGKAMGMEGAAGFFNAVLRNLSRGKADIAWPKREDGLREYLHIMGSMPLWIVDKLLDAYGPEEAEGIIMHRETEHPVVIRPNLTRIGESAFEALLREKGWNVRRGLAPHAYLLTGVSDIGLDPDYQKGLFSIQGQSSMLAAEAMQLKPGMRVLDACAAPGGKSAYLCEAMQNTGRVYAWELHEKRAMLIESAKRRLGLESLRVSVRDATEPKKDLEGTLDAVLLDAPCSGLGVMVQKPDLKYRVKPEDIEPIVRQQEKLLSALCRYVRPGGLLVYSTCSILPEENAQQVEAFLREHPDFALEKLPLSFPESLRRQQTPLGVQLLGYRDGVEGFFIARLRRAKA